MKKTKRKCEIYRKNIFKTKSEKKVKTKTLK